MSRAIQLLILASALALSACRSAGDTKLPDPASATVPVVQVVTRYVYVPIDASLTRQESIAEGPLAECPRVAAERRASLQRTNARLREIGQVQGTAVEPGAVK